MRRGRIEPPSARPVALRSSAILRLRAALIRPGGLRPAGSDASSPQRVVASSQHRSITSQAFQRAPRTGAVVPPGRCPEASWEWVVTPPAGAAPIPTNGTPPDGCPSGMRCAEDRRRVKGRGLVSAVSALDRRPFMASSGKSASRDRGSTFLLRAAWERISSACNLPKRKGFLFSWPASSASGPAYDAPQIVSARQWQVADEWASRRDRHATGVRHS